MPLKTQGLKRDHTSHAKRVYNAAIIQNTKHPSLVLEFISDAGRLGMASEGTAVILFLLALWEHARDKTIPFYLFACLSVPLFWLGGFLAWRKKHIAVEKLEREKELPKIFLRYEQSYDTDFYNSGFFVQMEGEKRAFDVHVSSEPVVGQGHRRITMQWEVPKKPIGTTPVAIHASCMFYNQQDIAHPAGGISGRQVHRFFEEKKDFPNELEVTVIYKDVDGHACPPRKFKVTSNRDYRGNFEIGCIPIEN